MRRYVGLLAVASVVLTVGFVAPQERVTSQPNSDAGIKPGLEKADFTPETDFAPGRILVKIKDEAPANAMESVNRENGARVEEKIPNHRVNVVDLPEGLSVAEAIEHYEASPEVEYAEPDYEIVSAGSVPTPNDPSFPKMWDMNNRGQTGGTFDADIDAPEAWRATTGSADIVVAVIDTGMDLNHPELRDSIWTNPGEIPDNRRDDDKNGYVDDVHGWDFYHDDPSVFDNAQQDIHATHVAGTIVAQGNNDRGVAGLGWRPQVMPLKFIGPNNASYVSDAAAAIYYSVDQGAEISNNSWGYDFTSKTLEHAIDSTTRAEQVFVAAAMNGGADFVGDNNDSTPMYPASYTNPNIISVAASNDRDKLTSFSNYGPNSVDLAAPGIDILSTLPGNSYGYGYGTSMATPHVTGTAALVKSRFSGLNADGVRARVLGSVDKKVSLWDKVASGGRLNAAKALGANTAPVILGLRPGSRVRTSKVWIGATVRDDETDLRKSRIQLYLDGHRKSFSYDPDTDRLSYRTGKLAARRHNVRVIVKDARTLTENRSWSFEVR